MCRIFPTLIAFCFATSAIAADSSTEPIDFNHDIRPILSNKCIICHGPDQEQRPTELRLDVPESATSKLKSGVRAIVPGKPEASEVVKRITTDDIFTQMPPHDSDKPLTKAETALLIRWIAEGAAFEPHWAYVPPERPAIPAVNDAEWCRNPIDRFVLARLESEGITPAEEASRYTLARRVALDLTGISPEWREVKAFVADDSPGAYERFVDRLLASPAYGEKRARKWLDLARYADSAGYADDPPRTIWAYRNYVIRSFNENKPFDQFTIEQIAGDLLPDPSSEQLIATAFHRNTMTNSEGGTIDEEWRNAAIVDRVNTTMSVWMGTTMKCAQCHTHKYDPLTQTEYFELFAFFNNTADADIKDERPTITVYSDEQRERRAALMAELREVEQQLASMPFEPVVAPTPTLKSVPPTPWRIAWDRRRKLAQQFAAIKPMTTVPVMKALPSGKRRETHLQHRGSYTSLGKLVTPGVPKIFAPLSEAAPPTRLTLAKWLVSENNPLTARVTVNRLWAGIFGRGIVLTSEDFGTQGELPSHPELLDWLAVEFMESGWDQKALLRLIVTSTTYRQSAATNPDVYQRDPANRLLARGPRFRLPAETIRDQALAIAGLLSHSMYGPPVKPPQPELGLKAAFGGSTDWKTSQGEDRYRRGIYTTWRRSNPYPSMSTFDAPSRKVCIIRRPRTNTPLQALVTLNDPVYVEAAQALARQMAAHDGSLEQKAAFGLQTCLLRPAKKEEVRALVALYKQAREEYKASPEQAVEMATNPLGPLPEGGDPAVYAAWTVVGNVLLNLDELLAKP